MRAESRATRKGGSPLGGERGLVEAVENGSEAVAEQVMAEAAACSKTPSCEQRVPYCWRTKWEVGVVAEIGAGEGGSVWVRKGLEELGTVALLFLVGCRETWQLWAGEGWSDPGFRKITLISSVEDAWR